jgi:F0F1-type ATP synthase membrane subunit b/b'
MEDTDILKHLMDIESRAQIIIADAKAESEKRLSAVKKEAEAKFERDYERRAKDLERKLVEAKAAIQREYEADIAGYERSLENLAVDAAKFARTVEELTSKNG